jgi:hypothetical protein
MKKSPLTRLLEVEKLRTTALMVSLDKLLRDVDAFDKTSICYGITMSGKRKKTDA